MVTIMTPTPIDAVRYRQAERRLEHGAVDRLHEALQVVREPRLEAARHLSQEASITSPFLAAPRLFGWVGSLLAAEP